MSFVLRVEKVRTSTPFTLLALLTAVSMLAGCSMSYSFGKSSDSISASFDSISGSSGSGGGEATSSAVSAYNEDVAAATVLFASGQKNSTQYLQTIASVGRNHGIVNWEMEKATYLAMGKGLNRAGISENKIVEMPYFRTLIDMDYTLVLQGYAQR